VIFLAISNLINASDFCMAWKHSKKDFFTMLVTMIFTFVYDTEIGLALGIGTSVLMYCVVDIILSQFRKPRLFASPDERVQVVRLESDLNFLTAFPIKDFIANLAVKEPDAPVVTNRSEYYRFQIASFF
jgi:MFS superfamily sulfate permease-like transporter